MQVLTCGDADEMQRGAAWLLLASPLHHYLHHHFIRVLHLLISSGTAMLPSTNCYQCCTSRPGRHSDPHTICSAGH